MKRLATAAGVVVFWGVFALEPAQGGDIQLGALVGPNFADRFGGEDVSPGHEEMRVRPALGAFAEIRLSDRAALRGSLFWMGKGSKGTGRTETGDGVQVFTWQRAFTYIEVPLLVKMDLGSGDKRPYALVGLWGGVLAHASYHMEVTSGPEQGLVYDSVVTGAYPALEVGFTGGVGYRAPVAEGAALLVELRYGVALSETNLGRNQGVLLNVGLSYSPD